MKHARTIFIVSGVAVVAAIFLRKQNAAAATVSDVVLQPLDYVGANLNFTVKGLRNNNPGNIRFNPANKWTGQVGDDGTGYAVFDEMENGIRAMAKLLRNYIASGRNSARKIVTSWAPANENNTSAYIASIVSQTGYPADAPLQPTDDVLIALMRAITRHENGYNPLTLAQFQEGLRRAA